MIEPHREDTDQAIPLLDHLCRVPFDEVPDTMRRRVYGVPYVQMDDTTGGRLWVTRHGWRLLEHLPPAKWYLRRQYERRGQRLSEGSGAVFCVSSPVPAAPPVKMIVKFSRMAQDLPLHVSSRFPGGISRHVLDEAVFNDPFQEFGLLEELRNSRFGPPSLKIRTKRPLAVYSPGRRFEAWQLGRTEDRFRRHSQQLASDQATLENGMEPVELSIHRQYIYLFHWIRGEDAESLSRSGALSSEETTDLVSNVIEDLAAKGFRVLDTKPNHVILRRRPDGQLLRRGGQFAYALVDFELLQRTEEYRSWYENGITTARTPPKRCTMDRPAGTGAFAHGAGCAVRGRTLAAAWTTAVWPTSRRC
jgi:hypothetical protein